VQHAVFDLERRLRDDAAGAGLRWRRNLHPHAAGLDGANEDIRHLRICDRGRRRSRRDIGLARGLPRRLVAYVSPGPRDSGHNNYRLVRKINLAPLAGLARADEVIE
jgi:hypothetical protein